APPSPAAAAGCRWCPARGRRGGGRTGDRRRDARSPGRARPRARSRGGPSHCRARRGRWCRDAPRRGRCARRPDRPGSSRPSPDCIGVAGRAGIPSPVAGGKLVACGGRHHARRSLPGVRCLGGSPLPAPPTRPQSGARASADAMAPARTRAAWTSAGVRRLTLLSIYWVAIGWLWNALGAQVLPPIITKMVGQAHQGTALSVLEGFGTLVAGVWQPVVGAVSDRTRLRWGRRRPYIAGGALGSSLFLVIMAFVGAY